jgi:hypothetical protein
VSVVAERRSDPHAASTSAVRRTVERTLQANQSAPQNDGPNDHVPNAFRFAASSGFA